MWIISGEWSRLFSPVALKRPWTSCFQRLCCSLAPSPETAQRWWGRRFRCSVGLSVSFGAGKSISLHIPPMIFSLPRWNIPSALCVCFLVCKTEGYHHVSYRAAVRMKGKGPARTLKQAVVQQAGWTKQAGALQCWWHIPLKNWCSCGYDTPSLQGPPSAESLDRETWPGFFSLLLSVVYLMVIVFTSLLLSLNLHLFVLIKCY